MIILARQFLIIDFATAASTETLIFSTKVASPLKRLRRKMASISSTRNLSAIESFGSKVVKLKIAMEYSASSSNDGHGKGGFSTTRVLSTGFCGCSGSTL